MPLPSKTTWLGLCGDIPPGFHIYRQIGQDLQIIAASADFSKYRAMGILHERVRAAIGNRGGAFYDDIPEVVQALTGALMAELKSTALLVCQNEFATVGTDGQPQPFIFSTGFYNCFGLVIFDQTLQRATLAHKAPATSAELAVDAMIEDFGDLTGASLAYVFGSDDSAINVERRAECVALLSEHIRDVRVIPRAALSADNGYGLFFDRRSGEYGVVRGNVHAYTVNNHPEMSVQTAQRQRTNTANDNDGERAVMLSALRTA